MLVRTGSRPGLPAAVERETRLNDYLGHSIRDIRQVEAFLLREPPAAVVYGSHRPKPGDAEWEQTSALGTALALANTSVRTGAGPGVMSAAPAGFALGSSACDGMLAHTQGIHLAGLRVESKVSPHIARENFIRLRNFRYREQGLILNNVAAGGVTPGAGFPQRGGLSTLQELVHEICSMQASGQEKPLVLDPWWKATVDALYPALPEIIARNIHYTNDPAKMAEKLVSVRSSGIDVRAWSRALQREVSTGLRATLSGPEKPIVFAGGREGLSAATRETLTTVAAGLVSSGIGMRVGQSGALASTVAAQGPVDAYLDAGDMGDGLHVRQTFAMKPAQQDVLLYDMGALVVHWPGDVDAMAALFATITEIRHNKRAAVPIVITGDLDAARAAWDVISDSRSGRLGEKTDAAKDAFYGVTFSNDPKLILETISGAR